MTKALLPLAALLLATGCGSAPAEKPAGAEQDGISTSVPTIPFVLADTLFVDGKVVPGAWGQVRAGGDVWVARRDEGWWWGTGPTMHRLPGNVQDAVPSTRGRLISTLVEGDHLVGTLVVREARVDGQVLGKRRIELPDPDGRAEPDAIGALTDEGVALVTRFGASSLVWDVDTGRTVDLADTAPGLLYAGDTPAGVRWSRADLESGFIGTFDAAGHVTPTRELATTRGWISPGGTRTALWGADLASENEPAPDFAIATRMDGTDPVRLHPPQGWEIYDLLWESEDLVVLRLMRSPASNLPEEITRLARCSITRARCVPVPTEF